MTEKVYLKQLENHVTFLSLFYNDTKQLNFFNTNINIFIIKNLKYAFLVMTNKFRINYSLYFLLKKRVAY